MILILPVEMKQMLYRGLSCRVGIIKTDSTEHQYRFRIIDPKISDTDINKQKFLFRGQDELTV